ncbi:MAG: class I SAM-dependent methyltransferase [Proteobacteria bacterium]|nr:class I SAM-dependent methyltransferase [Pseudomonadota bacterium]
MGIARAVIKLLMREGKRENYFGNLLTMGRQDVYATSRNLKKWASEMDFQLKRDIDISMKGLITDNDLFLSLGFESIGSMDYNDYEQCTIIHDLNKDVPNELHNKYDLILDSGTSEHIFNFPKVLENYNKMLKVGGRIIHGLPSSNHVDHGFYMFSPTVFYDYYLANKWDVIESVFFKYYRQHDTKLWKIYKYTPGCLDDFSFGGLKGMYGIFFIFRKTINSTFNAAVQQGSYIKTWENAKKDKISHGPVKLLLKNFANRLPEWLHHILRSLYFKITQKRIPKFNLKLIAKY